MHLIHRALLPQMESFITLESESMIWQHVPENCNDSTRVEGVKISLRLTRQIEGFEERSP